MRFTVLFYALILLMLPGGCSENKKEEKSTEYNVLLLYMDDLRPQLGCYGNAMMHTPNIDKLAQEGILFDEAYCNVPVCGASRASMLTGIYPTKNIFINYNAFAEKDVPDAISFPKLFKMNGYTTISNGKVYHHLDDNMGDWDEVWRPYAFDKNNLGLSPTDYWQTLWKDYQLPENHREYKATGTGPAWEKADVNDTAYIDGLMTEKVIRDLKKLKKQGKPFLLAAGFISPHLPFNAPAKYWETYPERTISQPYNNFAPENVPEAAMSNWAELRAYSGIPEKGQVADSTAIKLIHGYYATAGYVDALIGKILKTLQQLGLDKNTIIVFVSDHGYNLQEHTLWAKYTSFRITARVPLIILVPGMEGGKTTHALVELVDIYPTLAGLCNLKAPEDQLEGKSLVPVLKDPALKGNDEVFIKTGNAYMIKTEKYGYTEFIDPGTGETYARMLYDHQNDPDENVNVADDPEYSDVVKMLNNTLHIKYQHNITGK